MDSSPEMDSQPKWTPPLIRFKYAYDMIGSSNSGCSEEYRGTAAFSEPETKALQSLIKKHRCKSIPPNRPTVAPFHHSTIHYHISHRGTGAFSEPEARALQSLVKKHRDLAAKELRRQPHSTILQIYIRITLTPTLAPQPTLIRGLRPQATLHWHGWGEDLAFPYSYDWRAQLSVADLSLYQVAISVVIRLYYVIILLLYYYCTTTILLVYYYTHVQPLPY